MDMDKLHSNIQELEYYADMCYDEWSETMKLLCGLATSDMISEELQAMLYVEVAEQLTNVKENATIIKHEENVTQTSYELEWH